MKQLLTYDRADEAGELFAMAAAIGLQLVRQADESSAVSTLLESEADILLVHLNPDPWTNLSKETSKLKDRFVFRFSTQGFPPTPPCGQGKNCFHVNRPTKGAGAFTKDQLNEFIEVLKQDGVLTALLAGTIPTVLRPFIQFREPHLVRALHMVLQGRLAQWALDPGHPLQAEASKELGFEAVSLRAAGDLDWLKILREILGSPTSRASKNSPDKDDATLISDALNRIRDELSQKRDSNDSPTKAVKDMLEAWLRKPCSPVPAQPIEEDEALLRIKQDQDLFPLLQAAFRDLEASLGRAKEGTA